MTHAPLTTTTGHFWYQSRKTSFISFSALQNAQPEPAPQDAQALPGQSRLLIYAEALVSPLLAPQVVEVVAVPHAAEHADAGSPRILAMAYALDAMHQRMD